MSNAGRLVLLSQSAPFPVRSTYRSSKGLALPTGFDKEDAIEEIHRTDREIRNEEKAGH